MLWNSRSHARTWNPFLELERARERMDQLFASVAPHEGPMPTNLWVNEAGVRLVALLPGVDPRDVDVTVEGRDLRVAVRRAAAEAPTEPIVAESLASDTPLKANGAQANGAVSNAAETDTTTWRRRERSTGEFERTFRLPFPVETDRTRASFADGRLEVDLPRAASDQPRRIDVRRN